MALENGKQISIYIWV